MPLSDRTSRRYIAAALLSLLFLVPLPRAAHAQSFVWAARHNGFNDTSDALPGKQAIAVDTAGNVYVTGSSYSSATNYDWATVKYDPNGQRQWVATYNGTASSANDQPVAIGVDTQGGVYVTGNTQEGGPTAVLRAITTIRYNAATGKALWVQHYEPSGGKYVQGTALAMNGQQAGSVYVGGFVQNAVSATSNADFLALRYNSATGAQTWVALYNTPTDGSEGVEAIAVDTAGNCYATGSTIHGGNDDDYLTVKFAAADGHTVWSTSYNGTGNAIDDPTAIVVDGQSNVIVTGASSGGAATKDDYATIKYDGTTGVALWTARYDDPAIHGFDDATAIGVDSAGSVYVTGTSTAATLPTGGPSYDYLTVKYAGTSGLQQWAMHYDGGPDDEANALVVDSTGNVTVTGTSYGGPPSSGGTGNDIATVTYNTAGVQQWVRRYNASDSAGTTSSNPESGLAVALDAQGDVYVGGGTDTSNPDFLTLKYRNGSQWTPQDIAVGTDNKTRFLWKRADGALALWTVTASGTIEASHIYGPYAGLTPRALAVGSDNKPRVLWDGGLSRATIWTVKADLSAVETGYSFTASGYNIRDISVGATDGKTRLSWANAAGKLAVWTLTGGSITQSGVLTLPSGGYTDQAIAVGADNRIRLVWDRFGADSAALWTLNATTLSTIDAGYSYGPLSPAGTDWYIADVAVGSDNKPRVLWTNANRQAALWQISATSSTIEKGTSFAALAGRYPTRLSFSDGTGSDGNVRMLWINPNGGALLYTVNPATSAIVTSTAFGPL